MGGGIASAIARALGARRRQDADALVLHALAIAAVFSLVFTVGVVGGGRWLYTRMGGTGGALDAALRGAEINRKRVPAERLAFVSHATNPIVHAADDESVMQTLEALPFITRSLRAIYGEKSYRIGPSTIPMRQNPYGSRTMDNPEGGRIPMAHRDPRHNALFGAAFALG